MDGSERLISTEQVYSGRAVRLRVDTVEKPGGKRTTRDVVEHDDVIVAVPFDAEGRILLVRQYRHAVGMTLLELPAGGIDPGETPEQAVVREMREETGYMPKSISKLGGFYAAPGYCTEFLHLFRVSDLVWDPLRAEDTDGIEVVRIDPGQAARLITNGTIRDAKSIAGILSYTLYQ